MQLRNQISCLGFLFLLIICTTVFGQKKIILHFDAKMGRTFGSNQYNIFPPSIPSICKPTFILKASWYFRLIISLLERPQQ